jgi:hypothetical protein
MGLLYVMKHDAAYLSKIQTSHFIVQVILVTVAVFKEVTVKKPAGVLPAVAQPLLRILHSRRVVL